MLKPRDYNCSIERRTTLDECRIARGNCHPQPIPSLGARKGEGAKANTTTTTTTTRSTRVIKNQFDFPTIKNLRPEMQDIPPIPSILPELTRGLALTIDADESLCVRSSAPTFVDEPPSQQRTTNSSNLKTCLHPDEATKTSKQGLPTKKVVDFSTTVRVRIIHRKTDKELQEVWYSHEEKEQLLLQAQKAVKLRRCFMSENNFEDRHGESTLGIEHYLSKTLFKELQREKEEIIQSVLLFQETMMAQNKPIDHEALGHAYSTLSSSARERAYLTGRNYSLPFSHMMGQSEQRKQRRQRSSQDLGLRLSSSAGIARQGPTC